MTEPYVRGLNRVGRAIAFVVIWTLAMPMPVTFGDPKESAPAHGLNSKYAPVYLGYAGKRWDRDYGVLDGRCSRQAVGTALGAVVGGTTGSPARQVAIVRGAVAEAVAGRDLDEKDRACLGQTLELGGIERDVAWTNADYGVAYRVMPLAGYTDKGWSCREFVARIIANSRYETVRHTACSAGDGVWQIAG